jgi:hypothetical protein
LRYLICSDIHSNLEALQAVLRDAERERVDRLLMLGDLVGYGPDPKRCIREARGAADVVLAGNHDHGVVSLTDISCFNSFAQAALLWTKDQLSEQEGEYLAQLPLLYASDSFFLFIRPPKTPKRGNTSSRQKMQSAPFLISRDRSVLWDTLISPSFSSAMRRGNAEKSGVPESPSSQGYAISSMWDQ